MLLQILFALHYGRIQIKNQQYCLMIMSYTLFNPFYSRTNYILKPLCDVKLGHTTSQDFLVFPFDYISPQFGNLTRSLL